MHQDLVKRLRCLKYGNCPDCPMWYSEEVEPNLWRERCAAIDAADAIEELLQKMQQLPRWIPVTERLPEEMKTVLVTDGKNVGWSFCVNDYGTMEFYSAWKITHWMPLPEPPKEGET